MEKSFWQQGGSDYARYRPTYPDALAAALAAVAPPQGLALDVGCGTGQLSALLGEHFQAVVGCDVSADQLTNAKKHPNVTYKIGSAENIVISDKSADLIVAAQAAHWFNLPAFYNEVRRIGREEAVIALVTYGVFEIAGPANVRAHQFYSDIHSFWPKGREHVENGYRDFDFPFEPILMPALVIEREWDVDHFVNYCHTWSAIKRARTAGRGDILEKMADDLKEILGADGTLPIRWPISIRAGRV